MSRTLDPYAILGVDPRADDDVVKRAYRRGVLAWHPDQSDAPDACERLREVQWAWEMIGEPERRRGWDEQAARRREPGAAGERKSRRAGREHFWNRRRRSPPAQPADRASGARDLFVELSLTDDEADRGMDVPIEVPWRVPCDECAATGIVGWRRCGSCGGAGVRESTRTFEVTVPPGARDGARASVWLQPGRSQMHIILRRV